MALTQRRLVREFQQLSATSEHKVQFPNPEGPSAALPQDIILFPRVRFPFQICYLFGCDAKRLTCGDQDEANLYSWRGFIVGPVDSPFEGVRFELRIQVPSQYPNIPPKVWFVNKIFHPNVHPKAKKRSFCSFSCGGV